MRPPQRSTLFPTRRSSDLPTGPMVPVNTIRMERTGRQMSPTSAAPLLTDRETAQRQGDRKSTRLNSSHANISYAVFCLKKKKQQVRRKNHIQPSRTGERQE